MTMLAAHNFAKIIKTGTREEKNTITEKKYIIKQYKFTHTLVCFNNFSITVEARYFEAPREMENSSKQRGFEITGEA